MNTESRKKSSSADGDVLVTVARTIGSALGTVASKISPTTKSTRRRRAHKKTAKRRASKPVRTVSGAKARSKGRK